MTNVVSSALSTIIVLGIPVIFALILTYLNKSSKKLLVEQFGFASQVWLGGLGIIVHESSHAIVALIFGHRVIAFKPLILPKNVARNDGMLGYVTQVRTSNSLYQQVGDLFIGTAPIWGCTAAIYLTMKFTMPNLFRYVVIFEKAANTLDIETLKRALFSFNFLHDSNLIAFLIGIVGLLIIINIVLGGFDLSSADMNNSVPAFITLFILIFGVLLLLNFVHLGLAFTSFLFQLIISFAIIMSLSSILSVFINLGLRILRFFG